MKIKIERPDRAAAVDIFDKYMTAELPIHESETRRHSGDLTATLARMIEATIEAMYSVDEENRFLEVTYAQRRQGGPVLQGLRVGRNDRVGRTPRQEARAQALHPDRREGDHGR